MKRRAFLSRLTATLAGLAGGFVTLSSSDDKDANAQVGRWRSKPIPSGGSMTTDEFDQILQEDIEYRRELEHQRESVFYSTMRQCYELTVTRRPG